MARHANHDILFEPVRIGPVTAPNRFYQVPHCSGMPHLVPLANARMRQIKAEGGWGVVSSEACSIHATSDAQPTPEDKVWDDEDVPYLALLAEGIHRHGALAALEILHHGAAAANRQSRAIPISPRGGKLLRHKDPVQARRMDKADIRELRAWHRAAAVRAKRAGFDIVYVYAGHEVSLPLQFLWRRFNDRTDAYGGSLENRSRLLRELLEETHEAVGDTCAVALRFTVEELIGPAGITADGEGREVVEMLADVPDLWDVTVSSWANDSATARFVEEGWQVDHVGFVKSLTDKPVVGTGRYTSPDLMAAAVRKGQLDMIGAARPSIADPFLPKKIEEGRYEAIRECIGCNVCVTGNNTAVPIRCTQNPTMGEEHRRGWHPERIAPKVSEKAILVVGGGPAGLECTLALGNRGYRVLLADKGEEFGGRLLMEARLPGFASWARVRDYRMGLLRTMVNVDLYPASPLSADDIMGFAIPHVVLATGASWRADGVGQARLTPVEGLSSARVLTPEAAMAGEEIASPVLIYDDDHFYLGGALAERFARDGHEVTLVTPAAEASQWTHSTLEQMKIQTRLLELGVAIRSHRVLQRLTGEEAELSCVFTGRRELVAAATTVMVTERTPHDALSRELSDSEALKAAGIESVSLVGDAFAPATVAHAVHHGHRFAREFEGEARPPVPYTRELIELPRTTAPSERMLEARHVSLHAPSRAGGTT